MALIDPEARVMAAVHAGWRGTAAGAVGRALDAMAELGGRNDRVVAFIGPTVEPGRYQVDEAVRRALTEATAPHALQPDVACPDGPGHWLVDLVAANRQQLHLAGVPPAQIIDGGTSTSDDDFFSDRAARPCGRFALMAQLLAS
jgi:copper oxidase (laccase) domain-containing protein